MRGWIKHLLIFVSAAALTFTLAHFTYPKPEVKCYIIEATYPVQQAPDSLAPPVEQILTQICFQELTQGE